MNCPLIGYVSCLSLLLIAVVGSGCTSCRPTDSRCCVLELIVLETGYDTPEAFCDLFAWGNNTNTDIHVFGWPAEAAVSADVMHSALLFTNTIGRIEFPGQTLAVGKRVSWKKDVPYVGCVTWKGYSTKRIRNEQSVEAHLDVKLQQIQDQKAYMNLGFGYQNTLQVFDSEGESWGTVRYGGFSPEDVDVVLPLGQWFMTMMLLEESEKGNLQYVAMRISAMEADGRSTNEEEGVRRNRRLKSVESRE